MKIKTILSKKGFTLVELVVAITVAGIILAAVGTYFTNSYVAALKEQKKVKISSDAKMALDRIVQDIRSTTGGASNSVVIYDSSGNVKTNTGDTGSIIYCNGNMFGNTNIWYGVNTAGATAGTRLLRLVNSNTTYQSSDWSASAAVLNTSTISSNVKNFNVAITSADVNYIQYKISLTLSQGSGINNVTTTVETKCTRYFKPN